MDDTAKRMNIKARQETAIAYTSMSRWYDIFLFSEKNIGKKAVQLLDPKPGETILEIGYGTGYNILKIAGMIGETGKVFGIDISAGMYTKAQNRLKRNKITNSKIICGDAINLPYPGNSFDAVFMSFTLELFSEFEITAILNECKRVMKKTGRICIASMAKTEKSNLMLRFYEWLHRKFPKYVDCRPVDLKEIFRKSGFDEIKGIGINAIGLKIKIKTASLRF